MSKKQVKAQASSGRAVGFFGGFTSSEFGSTKSSPLSCIQELPDYSVIRDANVLVVFKNLSKKDSTTKTKALEDIQTYVSRVDNEIEEGLLETWVRSKCCTVDCTVDSDKGNSGEIIPPPLH